MWMLPVFDRATGPHIARSDTSSTGRARLHYLPALDGLRALAVLAVLCYHADLLWMPGGFLGVDAFFVLSGYLITALLLAEWQAQGSIDLAQFWLRRARRLLPALVLLLGLTLAGAVAWLPDEVARLRGDALAALAYVENWHLIFKQESYFERSGRPSLFQHLWSLAIEEQFYLIWPPVLGLLLRRVGRRGALVFALAAAGISAGLMAHGYLPDDDPSRLYYGTDTRAFALLIGAALACMRLPLRAERPPLVAALPDGVAFAALAGLGAALVFLDEYQPLLYRGGFVGVAVLTAVLIAALAHPRARLGRLLLGNSPMRWLGTRSYAIYLWHWPVFMVTRPDLDVALDGWPLLAVRLAATALLAEVSYRYVEAPVRAGALGRAWQALREARGLRRWRLGVQWAGASAVGLALAIVLGVVVAEARPPAVPAELAVEAVRDTPVGFSAKSIAAPTPQPRSWPTSTATPRARPAAKGVEAFELPEYRVPSAVPLRPTASPAPSAVPAPAVALVMLSPTPVGPQPDTAAASVTALGDSVMVGASRQLHDTIDQIYIDAAVSRQAKTALALLSAKREAGQLGEVVVVHIGTNGPFSMRQFDAIMQTLADVRRVVFVTVKVPRRWETPNNAVIAEGVARYSNTRLADWHAATADHPELFARDGVHPQRAGARLYAELIAAAIQAP
jgi:peptidoglycan/LPS O-acetylase OafA/YrhL